MNIISGFIFNIKHNRLSYRLLLYVILCSLFFTLLATSVQLYTDYKKDLTNIFTNIQFIKDSYVPVITASVYNLDEKQIRIQLQGALKLQDIEYLQIRERRGEGEFRISEGNSKIGKDITREFPLEYFISSDKKINCGTLTVKASLKGVYQRLWNKIFVFLVSNAIMMFLGALCILLMINILVTRHLGEMARYTKQLDLNKLDSHLELDRKPSNSSVPDELEQVVKAINDMQERMRLEFGKRKEAEGALKEYSERLEEMVEERTKDLKDAQETLIRKEKLAILGQLAGGVGHELRNPLGVISNAVYYLKMVMPDAEENIKEYLRTISSEVDRSTKIVSDLLDFSRVKSIDKEEIGITDLIAQILERQPAPENMEIVTTIPPGLPLIFVDPLQIGQVFDNLINNAYQAMPEGGKLTIEAKSEGDMVHVSVTDTGSGISKENMGKLFEPLFTTRARGIGLGLAVSKNLMEANGGGIEVESEEGKGSIFTVIFPIKEAA